MRKILAVFIGLVVVAVAVVAWALANPNRFKPELAEKRAANRPGPCIGDINLLRTAKCKRVVRQVIR